MLETNIKYLRELRGDEVTITCEFEWDGGKMFRIHQEIRKLGGTVAAKVTVVRGVLDLTEREFVTDPGERFRTLAERPDLLGL